MADNIFGEEIDDTLSIADSDGPASDTGEDPAATTGTTQKCTDNVLADDPLDDQYSDDEPTTSLLFKDPGTDVGSPSGLTSTATSTTTKPATSKKRKDVLATPVSKRPKAESRFAELVKDEENTRRANLDFRRIRLEESGQTRRAQLDVQKIHVRGRADAKKLKYEALIATARVEALKLELQIK
jgi:hypothetical protein